ncbi:uncharacterized protein [Halyomorpha halys]|uniref:uncharacterized protein n=1 Tax=Halyomorpha halys TaxID=286706 RepID=UPI0034D181F8
MQPLFYFTSLFAASECLLEEERMRKDKRRDLLGNLPPELASSILRYLDVSDLLTMMDVNSKWSLLIDSDPILRRRLARARAAYKRVEKENRDYEARRTLSKLRKNEVRKRKRLTEDRDPVRKKSNLRL